MDLFSNAKSVRLRSHHAKYLAAEDDEESVCQDRQGATSKRSKWLVEFVENSTVLRFKSCYGKYLTATETPFFLGLTGKKVLQTLPRRLDSSLEWEPIREGFQVRLKTRYGNFLRANGGLPPWRNSITHDIPSRSATREWILWSVEVVEILPISRSSSSASEPVSPSNNALRSPRVSRLESHHSFPRSAGREIFYRVIENDVNLGEEFALCFNGNEIEDLKNRLKEETGIEDFFVCLRNPLNGGKLCPLRLALPPSSSTLHLFVVPSSSRAAADVEMPPDIPTSS